MPAPRRPELIKFLPFAPGTLQMPRVPFEFVASLPKTATGKNPEKRSPQKVLGAVADTIRPDFVARKGGANPETSKVREFFSMDLNLNR